MPKRSKNDLVDVIYVNSKDTKQIIEKCGVYPEGYYISHGRTVDGIVIAPRNKPKPNNHQIRTIKITCKKLAFGLLKKAIGVIS